MTVTTVVCWLRRRALLGLVAGTGFLMAAGSAQASPLLVENFGRSRPAPAGRSLITASPRGSTGWFQGNGRYLPSQAGAVKFVDRYQLQQSCP